MFSSENIIPVQSRLNNQTTEASLTKVSKYFSLTDLEVQQELALLEHTTENQFYQLVSNEPSFYIDLIEHQSLARNIAQKHGLVVDRVRGNLEIKYRWSEFNYSGVIQSDEPDSDNKVIQELQVVLKNRPESLLPPSRPIMIPPVPTPGKSRISIGHPNSDKNVSKITNGEQEIINLLKEIKDMLCDLSVSLSLPKMRSHSAAIFPIVSTNSLDEAA